MESLSSSPSTTKKIAEFLAKEVLKHKNGLDSAFVVGLVGDLGSGKTTFIQGFAGGLQLKRHLTSPTFLIIRSYKFRRKVGAPTSASSLPTTNYKFFYHIDCYRIKKSKELSSLGFKEIITDPANIILIEWANKVRQLLPKKMLWIKLKHGKKENERVINISLKTK
ncbi:MAG: tRNA (adenosine(37)-N6)-threonylcarbamoyltransferase complex ATPase subunit type 1 TsaE [Patescibacteria group bacterium]|nr:tRNA (adenosine(37)-N6)-threonylcarbamoyltransferase complex ATPase subunit type 1 TsaE [Patescibacteria group bacterium]